MKRYHIIVYGIVQGVGFRYFTKQKADALGLFGEVKNLNDGTVQIKVSGDEKSTLKFLEWCHNGPPSSTVNKLEYEELASFESNSFEIVR